MPVAMMKELPMYLCVREVKGWYVEYLMKMLLEEDDDHEDITAPLLVVASVSKAEFKPRNVSSYT